MYKNQEKAKLKKSFYSKDKKRNMNHKAKAFKRSEKVKKS